ncbi:signal transduction histidine kinase [Paenibacillus castaneae]|uniref:sensor histidine kinase n=1 Tax=Paenibacillus castaneae TaxID=474957 RepID=UPI00141A728D|nr:sensor histidine kinase [Paenibacillus castaneae]NIK75779.1 signal transduction histidine kinase [Paenibacillus castaneae]
MNKLLYRIRILLVAVPAVISMNNIDAGSYATYTALVLLALLLIKAGRLLPQLANLFLLAELIGFGALSYLYGGVLFLLIFSTLIAAFRSKPAPYVCAGWTIAGLAVLYIVLSSSGRNYELIIAVLLLWAAIAAILYTANEFEDKRHKVEDLYEALALSHEQLDSARLRMLEYASQVEHYAQVEERNRIAKDIHDDLGHRLIRVKMMSEAALHLFESDTMRSRAMVAQIRDQLQDSMERMRRTVRKLTAEDVSDVRRYALDRLVEESVDALGIAVSFEVGGFPRPMYPSMELSLFKNAQEAITNAVRHGNATAVSVRLQFQSNFVALTVSNNGSLPTEPIEAGLGLRGMKERIALIGGRLEWQQSEQFSITTILPLLGE